MGDKDRAPNVCVCVRVLVSVCVCVKGGKYCPHTALLSTFLLVGLGAPVALGTSLLPEL